MVNKPTDFTLKVMAAIYFLWIIGYSTHNLLGDWLYFVPQSLMMFSVTGLIWLVFRKSFKGWKKALIDTMAWTGCNDLLDELAGLFFRQIGWNEYGQPTDMHPWEYVSFLFFILIAYNYSWKYGSKRR